MAAGFDSPFLRQQIKERESAERYLRELVEHIEECPDWLIWRIMEAVDGE